MISTLQAQAEKSWSAYEEHRIGMTVSCRDSDVIPKVAGTGKTLNARKARAPLRPAA
jgi:hypothetical protein